MARYIDADKLIKKVFPYNGVDKKNYSINAQAVYEAINNAPTEDVAKVVRCKDCEAYDEYTFCEHMGMNGFCSYGERKSK